MTLVEIDGRTIKTERDFHIALCKALDFGPYYGNNLDALWDSLGTSERPIRLVWSYSSTSQLLLGRTFDAIVKVLQMLKDHDDQHGWTDRFDYELR